MDIEESRKQDRQIVEAVERALGATGQLAKALDAGLEVLSRMDRDKPMVLQRDKPYYGKLKIERWEPVVQAIGRVQWEEGTHEKEGAGKTTGKEMLQAYHSGYEKDPERQPAAMLRAFRKGCSHYTNGVAMAKIEQVKRGQVSLHEGVAWAQLSSRVGEHTARSNPEKLEPVRREARRLLVRATQAGPEAQEIHDVERRRIAKDVFYDAQAPDIPLAERRTGWRLASKVEGEFQQNAIFHVGKSLWVEGKMRERRSIAGVEELEQAAKMGDQNAILLVAVHGAMVMKGLPGEGNFVDNVAELVMKPDGAYDDLAQFMAGTVLDTQGTTKRHAEAAEWADELGRSLYCEPARARGVARHAANEGSPEQARKNPRLCELAGYALTKLVASREAKTPEERRNEARTMGEGWLREDQWPHSVMEDECRKMCRNMGVSVEEGIKRWTGEPLKELERRNVEAMERGFEEQGRGI